MLLLWAGPVAVLSPYMYSAKHPVTRQMGGRACIILSDLHNDIMRILVQTTCSAIPCKIKRGAPENSNSAWEEL